jgi:hypothetical protein
MSLINIKNNVGLTTAFCGTPFSISKKKINQVNIVQNNLIRYMIDIHTFQITHKQIIKSIKNSGC